MAFLRIEKKKSGTYLRIVESYRDENKVCRHKTLYNLGKAEDYSKKTLRKMGRLHIELSGGDAPAEPKNFKELRRVNYGFGQVYHSIMIHYGIDKLLGNIENETICPFLFIKQSCSCLLKG